MTMERLKYLDGLRGLMALNVVLCHFVCVYYPQMYAPKWSKWGGVNDCLSVFCDTPLNALINGNIAVQFFFLLSGFLAALSVFSKQGLTDLGLRFIKCYLRLLPMIAGATIFTYILMKAGLLFHLDISENVDNKSFLSEYCNFVPTIKNLLYNIFVRPFILSSEYVGPFWYIKPDFWGYLLSLSICIIAKGYRWRRIGYLVVLIVMWWNSLMVNYSTFVLGIILADVYYYKGIDTTYFSKYYRAIIGSRWFAISAFVIGSFLAMIPMGLVPMYRWLPFIDSGIWQFDQIGISFYRALGLSLSLFGIFQLGGIQKLLEAKPVLWMGKVSFATYAFHWPVMLSLEAYLFGRFIESYSYTFSALLAFAITLPVIYLISSFATKYLDKSIKINKLCQFLRIRRC